MNIGDLNEVNRLAAELQNVQKTLSALHADPMKITLSVQCKDAKNGGSAHLPALGLATFVTVLDHREAAIKEQLRGLGVMVV